ncbi:MAG: AtpZ/AtpI family protein [Actinomycetota bacterium]
MSEIPETRSRLPRLMKGRGGRLSLQPVNRLVLGLNRPGGTDAGIGEGMEIALTLAVFFGLGWLIDSWSSTRPFFTIALSVFAVVGQSIRMWLTYDARMKVLEEERRERSRALEIRRSESSPSEGGSR